MRITFWGTRGSIPAPGPGTVRVGGNTTCLEVAAEDGTRIIVDAGTGIRMLGLTMMKARPAGELTLLLTHSHWDHLDGFIFFSPAYHPEFAMRVYGNRMAVDVLRRDIFERQDNRYFPVNMDTFRAKIEFAGDLPENLVVGGIEIANLTLNHPGLGFAYRFTSKGGKLAFITDNELGLQYEGGSTPEEIVEFCRGADALIHDAQFLPSEIEAHRGWGHSTYAEAADLAQRAGVHHLFLTHHDPERTDQECDAILRAARKYVKDHKYRLECDLAVEGESFVI